MGAPQLPSAFSPQLLSAFSRRRARSPVGIRSFFVDLEFKLQDCQRLGRAAPPRQKYRAVISLSNSSSYRTGIRARGVAQSLAHSLKPVLHCVVQLRRERSQDKPLERQARRNPPQPGHGLAVSGASRKQQARRCTGDNATAHDWHALTT